MNQTQPSRTSPLRRYLLGETDDSERSAIERRLMSDQRYLDDLAQAEEELIDQYARGELDANEKQEFETLFLSVPERREKIAFAQAFHRYLSRHSGAGAKRIAARISPVWQRVAAGLVFAALVLLASLSVVLYRKNIQAREQLANSELQRTASEKSGQLLSDQLSQQQKRNQELEQELAALRASQPATDSQLLTLALESGWNRGGGEMATANLSHSLKRLRLDLALGQDAARYPGYRVQLRTIEGKTVWSQGRLKATRNDQKRLLSVTVPAFSIAAGDYLVVLSDVAPGGTPEQIATYYFRAVRK